MSHATWKIAGCSLMLLCSCLTSNAQESVPSPSCVPEAGLRSELRTRLDQEPFAGVSFERKIAKQVAILDDLVRKFPRDPEPQRRLIDIAGWVDTRQLPAVRERFRKQELDNPNDALALFASGYSLLTTDAQAARRKLTQASVAAPDFPWPYFALAYLYEKGKTANSAKMAKNVERFFTLCPNATDGYSQWLLSKAGTDSLRKKVASGLRSYLEAQSDFDLLVGYETLWALEFQTHPPIDFPSLRKQVAEDLKRIESLNTKQDANFQAFLIRGYRQSGAAPEIVAEKENRLLTEHPKSFAAYVVAFSRWDKAHKRPEDQKDTSAWANYDSERKAAQKEWIHQFTDDYYLTHYAWTDMIEHDEGLSEKEVLEVFENDVKQAEESNSQYVWYYVKAAEYLLKHKMRPERAVQVLEEAENILARERESAQLNTNRTAEEIATSEDSTGAAWRGIVSSMLEAARQMNRPELVVRMRTEVEAPLTNKKYESSYWMNRARLARVDGRNADALTYYQLAHQTNTEKPSYRHGKIWDPFADEVRPFWKELGGSDTAWEFWVKPLPRGQELTEGRWEKAAKPLPSFELSDLTGKIWRLKELQGKVLLINFWATWCGPCQVELPRFQNLYQMTKNRDDILVLSFNMDEDPGVVGPFLKEHGYEFPVLLAHNVLLDVLSEGIPQNWIVNSKGTRQWKQMGFSDDQNWETTVLSKLEAAKTTD